MANDENAIAELRQQIAELRQQLDLLGDRIYCLEIGDGPPKLSKEAKSLAFLKEHPEWTDKEIAKQAGCSTRTLQRSAAFKAARTILAHGKHHKTKGNKYQGKVDADEIDDYKASQRQWRS